MTEPTAHMNHDHVYTGVGDNPAKCHCGGVHQPDTTQRDECEGCEVCDLATELADERTQHQETIMRAEAKLAAVRELHYPVMAYPLFSCSVHIKSSSYQAARDCPNCITPHDGLGYTVCANSACGDWPCPTFRATGGEAPNARAREGDHTGAAPEGGESGTAEPHSSTQSDDGEHQVTVYAHGLTTAAYVELFERVADAAQALDEEVFCTGRRVLKGDGDG